MKHSPTVAESEVGKRVKSLRAERRVTLEKLANLTGFSKGYLSKVEKSEKAPPVSTLGKIARALDVTISFLLGEVNHYTPISLVRKEERSLFTRDGTPFGYAYEAVAHKFMGKMMEPFILTLPVHPPRRTLYQHEGQEILFVLEGTMKFLHGKEEFIVNRGDCLYFDSGVPHFGESVGNKAVKCFMVIFNSGAR